MWVSLPVFTDTRLRLITSLHFPGITFPSPWDSVTYVFQVARFTLLIMLKCRRLRDADLLPSAFRRSPSTHLWAVQQLLLMQTSYLLGEPKCTEQRVEYTFLCHLRTPRIQGSDSNLSVHSPETQGLICRKSAPPSSYCQRMYSLFWGVCPSYVEPSFSRSFSTSGLGLTAPEWSRIHGPPYANIKLWTCGHLGASESYWTEMRRDNKLFCIIFYSHQFFLVKIWLIKLCKLVRNKIHLSL